ncbi:hypothetical protein HLRTI_000141 [Halorhabdus tiamatea SARL4B]|uniref:Uncharacterized protein n=1 Tax=Halorhabdus tiamatea SARL4B TaxID=1033806 RepID=F7PGJ1_9EURY|nr:hypothetical protein [Halorhabdus tiamatea]ERJ07767.1 hypothetical protein HLRTI_000141 [Halorhabdus tiamatea SARL4B]CCQ32574.1 conserved hypothetical protein [Halorhabdus tiamatea SARL4B]
MEDTLGIRIYAAAYVTAGILLAWIGSTLGALGAGSHGLDATLVGFATWIAFVFAGVVIALEGIVVVVQSTVEETGPNAG